MLPQVKNIKHDGNIPFDQIIEIARVMRPRSCAATLAGVCKEMLGTCQGVGCKVNGENPRDIIQKVRQAPCSAAPSQLPTHLCSSQGHGSRMVAALFIYGRRHRLHLGKQAAGAVCRRHACTAAAAVDSA